MATHHPAGTHVPSRTSTPDCGVIYVASQELRFLCQAIAAAESVRQVLPDLSITLFTDLIDDNPTIPPFDRVITFQIPVLPRISPWSKGLYARVACMGRSPYRRTVSLDTDTRVLRREFIAIFDDLEHYTLAAVPCTPESSHGCKLYGPMFNGGVIAYRRDHYSERLFRDWDALHRRHLALVGADDPAQVPYLAHLDVDSRQYLLMTNQTSLARLVSPGRNEYGMAVKELSEIWNSRMASRSQLQVQGVIVDHSGRSRVEEEDVGGFLEARHLSVLEHALAARADAIDAMP